MSDETLAAAFLAAVEEMAGPVLEPHGLERGRTLETGPNQASAVWKSEGARVTLDCDRGEIDALFEPRGNQPGSTLKLGNSFQLRLVLALAGVPDARNRWPRIIGRDTAQRSVGLLLDDLAAHAVPWMRGDDAVYDRLAHFRDVETVLKMSQYGPDRRDKVAWAPVKHAWERQDLPALQEAIEALEEPLRDGEEQALEYARRWQDG